MQILTRTITFKTGMANAIHREIQRFLEGADYGFYYFPVHSLVGKMN